MKAAFVLYDRFSTFEFAALFEPAARSGWVCETVARSSEVYDVNGLHTYAGKLASDLQGYDVVVVPGGPGATEKLAQPEWLAWLATASQTSHLAASGEGIVLLAAAGLLRGREAACPPGKEPLLADYGALPAAGPLVMDGAVWSAFGPRPVVDLGLALGRLSDPSLTPLRTVQGGSGVPAADLRRRQASVRRKTTETEVSVVLDLDGSGQSSISTGLPFLDHMLAQVAVHGLFDLTVNARGDLEVDAHHTLEDTALALGQAFDQALGDRAGITRMGWALVPMDDALAEVALDFSGRPYCIFTADWALPSTGGLANTLFAHFFESFAVQARCTLHLTARAGRDDHHRAEALFKAFARALSIAVATDPRRAGNMPSSKGKLV